MLTVKVLIFLFFSGKFAVVSILTPGNTVSPCSTVSPCLTISTKPSDQDFEKTCKKNKEKENH